MSASDRGPVVRSRRTDAVVSFSIASQFFV